MPLSLPRAALVAVIAFAGGSVPAQHAGYEVPTIDGPSWQIAGNPDLGHFNTPLQQPVDFAIWQAADGTWQLWSCIRNTGCGGFTRLFHRWESAYLIDHDWQPMGIAMLADTAVGEQPGGLQAPHVFVANGRWYMVYGDFLRICLASSDDGKTFRRAAVQHGEPNLFTGPYANTRDAMVLRYGNLFACYYTGSQFALPYPGAVFCRTSSDLFEWSEPTMVCAGGNVLTGPHPFDSECPFVIERNGWYYLFRNQVYGPGAHNTQYASKNPFAFGVGTDVHQIGTLPIAAPEIVYHQGRYLIAYLNPNLDGIRLAHLRWVRP